MSDLFPHPITGMEMLAQAGSCALSWQWVTQAAPLAVPSLLLWCLSKPWACRTVPPDDPANSGRDVILLTITGPRRRQLQKANCFKRTAWETFTDCWAYKKSPHYEPVTDWFSQLPIMLKLIFTQSFSKYTISYLIKCSKYNFQKKKKTHMLLGHWVDQKIIFVPFNSLDLVKHLSQITAISPNIANALIKTLPAFRWQFGSPAECTPCATGLLAASLICSHEWSAGLAP